MQTDKIKDTLDQEAMDKIIEQESIFLSHRKTNQKERKEYLKDWIKKLRSDARPKKIKKSITSQYKMILRIHYPVSKKDFYNKLARSEWLLEPR